MLDAMSRAGLTVIVRSLGAALVLVAGSLQVSGLSPSRGGEGIGPNFGEHSASPEQVELPRLPGSSRRAVEESWMAGAQQSKE